MCSAPRRCACAAVAVSAAGDSASTCWCLPRYTFCRLLDGWKILQVERIYIMRSICRVLAAAARRGCIGNYTKQAVSKLVPSDTI
eukprot:3549277-Pleurochrysis_carterae.AAC.3